MASPLAKSVPQDASKSEMKKSWAGRVPHLKPGKYADGMPLHEVEYLACKLILRPEQVHVAQEPVRFRKGASAACR